MFKKYVIENKYEIINLIKSKLNLSTKSFKLINWIIKHIKIIKKKYLD